MWHLMLKPHTCSRRDVMIIFFTDIKGSLYRSEVENVIEQLCSKMGPVETKDGCKAKQPAQNDDLSDDDKMDSSILVTTDLNILMTTNMMPLTLLQEHRHHHLLVAFVALHSRPHHSQTQTCRL